VGVLLSPAEVGNAHPSSGSYPPYPPSTVEQLQSECAGLLSHDPTVYDISFRPDDRGVPVQCTIRPKDCFDDCTTGIDITRFECAPLPSLDGGSQ